MMLMMAFSPVLNVVTIAPVPKVTCTHCPTMMMTSPLFSLLIVPLLVAALLVTVAGAKILMVLIVALPMLVCTFTHRVKMMTTALRTPGPSKNSLAP